jgi:hypothetical protein
MIITPDTVIVFPASGGQFERIIHVIVKWRIEQYFFAGLINEQEKERLLKEGGHAVQSTIRIPGPEHILR